MIPIENFRLMKIKMKIAYSALMNGSTILDYFLVSH